MFKKQEIKMKTIRQKKTDYSGPFALIFALALVGLWMAAIAGYVMNIINVFYVTSPVDVIDVMTIIGVIFAPLGAVMGWVV